MTHVRHGERMKDQERAGLMDGWCSVTVLRCCGVAELGTVALGIPHMNGTRGGGWGKVRDRQTED